MIEVVEIDRRIAMRNEKLYRITQCEMPARWIIGNAAVLVAHQPVGRSRKLWRPDHRWASFRGERLVAGIDDGKIRPPGIHHGRLHEQRRLESGVRVLTAF